MNLNQITLPSTDIKRSIEFYRGMGFILIVEALPHYARFECPDGGATFSLHLVESLDSNRLSEVLTYFEHETLDHWVQELKTKGYSFSQPPQDKRWLWREARLEDPDGNRLCLYWAGENRKNPPWREQGH